MKPKYFYSLVPFFCGMVIFLLSAYTPPRKAGVKRYLYVATPGIRDYLGYGGHGILVFDMDNNDQFVRRIKTQDLHPNLTPSNDKSISDIFQLNSGY